jgi:hypothetical protein
LRAVGRSGGRKVRASTVSRSCSAYSRCSHSSLRMHGRYSRTRVAAGLWPPGPLQRFRVAVERLVGQAVEDLTHGGHPVAAQCEHHVERRSCVAVSGHTRRIRHLVPWQVQGVPRRRMPEDRPADPGIGGEHEVPQRIGERPLTGDRLMQQLRVKPAGPGDGLAPRPLDDVPRVAEPARSVGRILSATPRPSLPHGRSARTRRPMRCPCQSRCDDRGRTAVAGRRTRPATAVRSGVNCCWSPAASSCRPSAGSWRRAPGRPVIGSSAVAGCCPPRIPS